MTETVDNSVSETEAVTKGWSWERCDPTDKDGNEEPSFWYVWTDHRDDIIIVTPDDEARGDSLAALLALAPEMVECLRDEQLFLRALGYLLNSPLEGSLDVYEALLAWSLRVRDLVSRIDSTGEGERS